MSNTMSKLDDDLRWIKKGYLKTNDADISKNYTLKPNTSDDFQKHISPNAFHTLKQKYDTKYLIKNGHKNINDGLSTCWSNQIKRHIISESTNKSDSGSLEKWPHITENNSLEHINMYPDALKGLNNKYSNSMVTSLNSIKDVPKCLNFNHISSESYNTSNNKHNLKNNTPTIESWRERNYTDKMRLAWHSYVNSLTGKIIPYINLHSIANPFLPIPIEVSRMANNINLNMAEVLCRKRTETAVIYWMVFKFNQLNAFK